jgi:hypothetical protein
MRAILAVAMAIGVSLTGCVYYLNPLCNDQIKNGEETGLDCGGTCGKCSDGEGCNTDADCDGRCMNGKCGPLPCDDEIKDGQETDVDCGGGACRRCAGQRMCQTNDDCFSGTCDPVGKTCDSLVVSFGPEQRRIAGYKPYMLLSDDLDADGDADLVVINEYGSSIGVYLNTAGAFTRLDNPGARPPDESFVPQHFGPTGAYPTGGALADFNHDGKLDVITADYHGDSVTQLFNTGTGVLQLQPSRATVDGAETSNLAVGDVNKDGNLDVVATNPQAHSISLFLGQADGSLAAGTEIPVGVGGAAQPYSAAIADFNRDGNPDLAIAEEVSGAIVVRLGNGDATFGDESSYPIDGVRDYIVFARDVNLDNLADLVVASRNSDTVSVLLSRGDGTFKKAIVTSVVPDGVTLMQARPWYGPYTVIIADVNMDGVPDLVTPNFLGDNVSILLGVGNGKFDSAFTVGFAKPTDPNSPERNFSTPYGVAVGDWNGDGKPDLATATAGSYELIINLATSHSSSAFTIASPSGSAR